MSRQLALQPLAALIFMACLCTLASAVAAHPHVLVSVETTVLYENDHFTGLQHKWTFDEYYTEMAIEGLDKNHDGIYDRQELSELAKVNMDGLKEFGYFTFPTVAGKAVKLGEPRDYWLEHTNGVLSLHFTLPFVEPIPAKGPTLSFTVQDETFFIAFNLAKVKPVKLSATAPHSCRATVSTPPENANNAQRLTNAFSQFALLIASPEVVSVTCR